MLFVIVRVLQSSKKQEKFFGEFAWRPYLNIVFKNPNLFNEEIIRRIIVASFYDEPVEGVRYEKYFDLEENEVFEFDYAVKFWDSNLGKFRFSKYRRISL